jgi:hypothetical protein
MESLPPFTAAQEGGKLVRETNKTAVSQACTFRHCGALRMRGKTKGCVSVDKKLSFPGISHSHGPWRREIAPDLSESGLGLGG